MVIGRNPSVAHEYLGESVEGKTVFIADDIIASGESMLEVARELRNRGAKNIIANATYPLFTSGYEKFDKAVEEGTLTAVLGTNLTSASPNCWIVNGTSTWTAPSTAPTSWLPSTMR